jgi:hypothetical protein
VEANGWTNEHITWRALAERNGRVLHPLVERETIELDSDAQDNDLLGSLAREQLEALLPILAGHTSSESGWYLLWEGFGDLNHSVLDRSEKVVHPMRRYYLLRGPLSAFREFPHDPNYWWPDDRAWCYCGDTDLDWAYLAGSASCIDEVLAVPVLDALRTQPEHPAHYGMDEGKPASDDP